MVNATQIDLTLDDQPVLSVTDTDLFYGQAALIIENTLPLTVVESFDVTESTPQPILTINHKPYRWTFIGGPLPSHLGIGFIPVPLCAMPPIDEPEGASSLPVPPEREVARYYHPDHLGTIRAVTNQAGNIVETHNPLPYGEELSPPSVKDPKMFTGKMRDSESGLDYFGKRYHSNKISRWLSTDPIRNKKKSVRNPQSLNLYTYCINNPITLIDLNGLDWLKFNGMNIRWYGGKLGDTSKLISEYRGVSGKSNFQNPNWQHVRNWGPAPEGRYRLSFKPNGMTKFEYDNKDKMYYSVPGTGLQLIPHDFKLSWGTFRMSLTLIQIKEGLEYIERENLYVHDSHKQETKGCTETDTQLKDDLIDYREKTGNESMDYLVDYDEWRQKIAEEEAKAEKEKFGKKLLDSQNPPER